MHPNRLGLELRRLRQGLGLRQRDLAVHISTTPEFISSLEQGHKAPPATEKLVALAHLLQVNPDDLLALAGRIPSDVTDLLHARPQLWQTVRDAAQS